MPKVSAFDAGRLPADYEKLVRKFPPQAIHDEVACDNVHEMIEALLSIPDPSKGQLAYLDTLTILFEAYEREHHSIDTGDLDPIRVLRHLMDERGMTASDLGRILGERSLGPKILNGRRDLSKAHIRTLADHFKVSTSLFL